MVFITITFVFHMSVCYHHLFLISELVIKKTDIIYNMFMLYIKCHKSKQYVPLQLTQCLASFPGKSKSKSKKKKTC